MEKSKTEIRTEGEIVEDIVQSEVDFLSFETSLWKQIHVKHRRPMRSVHAISEAASRA